MRPFIPSGELATLSARTLLHIEEKENGQNVEATDNELELLNEIDFTSSLNELEFSTSDEDNDMKDISYLKEEKLGQSESLTTPEGKPQETVDDNEELEQLNEFEVAPENDDIMKENLKPEEEELGQFYEMEIPKAADEGFDVNDDKDNVSYHYSSTIRRRRQVVVPKGKMGILVEMGFEGPTVSMVYSHSPLSGKVFKGDVITAIDQMDCHTMSEAAITRFMVHTADYQRMLTIESNHEAI